MFKVVVPGCSLKSNIYSIHKEGHSEAYSLVAILTFEWILQVTSVEEA